MTTKASAGRILIQMEPSTPTSPPSLQPYGRGVLAAGWIAMILALAAGTLLGVRTISSFDIGYHLAYGDRFLQTGRIVDSSPELYTLDGRKFTERTELPPGAWIDGRGRFRFPNANWLSQVIFSLVHRAGGMDALSVLQAVVVLGILLVAASTMRRMGLSPVWCGAGLLLISLTAFERFVLRPELLGYLVLAVELRLLLSAGLDGRPLTWRRLAVLAVLQWLLANLHSYWMLGVAVTLAALAGRAMSLYWPRSAGEESADRAAQKRCLKRLGLLLAAQAVVAFANPWTWRLALLPAQTLMFFRRHGISSGGAHPWAVIGEFYRPLDRAFAGQPATLAYYVVLGLAVIGLVAAAVRRRWTPAFWIVGFTAVSTAMRRNIAPGAVLVVPLALAAAVAMTWPRRPRAAAIGRVLSVASIGGAVLVAALAAALGYGVVSQHFYQHQRRADRFGLGVSKVDVPVLAAKWLTDHRPQGRLWTDCNVSSNVHYFTRPHPEVPILTNTWACPPEVMTEELDYIRGTRPFEEAVRKYGVEVVALRVGRITAEPDRNTPRQVPVALWLSANPDWALVHLDALHAVFLRKSGPNAVLARQEEITPDTFDVDRYVERLRALDPQVGATLYQGGRSLSLLGWNAQAIEVLREAVRLDGTYVEAWYEMGICFARLGMQYRSRSNYLEAEMCFQQCLRIRPDFEPAQQYLRHVREVLMKLR